MKVDERIKNVLLQTQAEHSHKIDQKITGIFLCGFLLGIAFSYTGLFGFGSGVITGIILTRKGYDTMEDTRATVSNIIKQAQKYLISIYVKKNEI